MKEASFVIAVNEQDRLMRNQGASILLQVCFAFKFRAIVETKGVSYWFAYFVFRAREDNCLQVYLPVLAADEVSFIAKRERSSFTNNTAVVTAK